MAASSTATGAQVALSFTTPDEFLKLLLNKARLKRLRLTDLFKSLDSDGDGIITKEEVLAGVAAQYGLQLTESDSAVLMMKLGSENGAKVTWLEFDRAIKIAEKNVGAASLLLNKRGQSERKQGLSNADKEEFRQLFCLFKQLSQARSQSISVDLVQWDSSGSIACEELEQLLDVVGMKVDPFELQTMIKEIDINNDGQIDFDEFCDVMTKKIQLHDYTPDAVTKSFQFFARNAPDGLIRVQDVAEALKVHMRKEMIDSEVDELLLHYRDCFITLPGSDVEYFNYQDYVDLMTPITDSAAAE